MSLNRPAKLVSSLTANTIAEAYLTAKLVLRLSKLSLQRVRINSREPSRMLIIDEDVKLAISKQRLETVPLALNGKLVFNPTFMQQNLMLASINCAFWRQNAKFVSNLKLCQNTRSASHFKNAKPASSLRPRQNTTFAFQF